FSAHALQPSLPALGLARRMSHPRWLCSSARSGEELLLDPDILSETTLAAATEPLRRLPFSRWVAGEDPWHNSEPFSADHRVFGSYGSIWSVFALADSRRWKQPNGEPACLASSGCGLTVRLARLLAEVDQWLQETRERRATEILALAQMAWPASEGSGASRPWLLHELARAWSKDRAASVAALGASGRLCLETLQDGAVEAISSGTWRLKMSHCADAQPGEVLTAWFLGSSNPSSSSHQAPARRWWRGCGNQGAVHAPQRVGPGGRLVATVLGISGWQAKDQPTTWEVEASLFVAPSTSADSSCVLVDGNRLFQTHPQSYLTSWTCTARSTSGFRATARSQGVVSYSGTVALIRCVFDAAPPDEPT
ncbi:unnamed protein product, partial [Symbiodinium sp. CCMP2456]